MEPHQPTPDWLRKLEVKVQILSADCGNVKVLREILLEDLAETEQVLDTDFVPWGTGKDQTDSIETASSLEMDPDFGVITEGIQEIQRPAEGEAAPAETGSETAEDVNYFSIFREFFRSYDRESKLILLDEIPEIGTEKELNFLEGLFEDPDEKIAARAQKVYALLARRLEIDPKAIKNKDPQALRHIHSASVDTLDKNRERDQGGRGHESYPEHEFVFIPEFGSPLVSKKAGSSKARRRKNRLFGFLGGTQNGTDE